MSNLLPRSIVASAPPLMFQARTLSERERRRQDLWSFWSPKLAREIQVVGPMAIMQALMFELDPNVRAYVERPRTLEVDPTLVELDFWTTETRGLERFWLLVPNQDAIEPGTPRREHRRAVALIEAAQRAHLRLEFVFEHDLCRRAHEIHTAKRLLPYVQTAAKLPNRDALRDQIRGLFDNSERATIDQLCAEMRGFPAADVRAGLADLIHAGELALTNPRELTRFSVLERRPHHGHN